MSERSLLKSLIIDAVVVVNFTENKAKSPLALAVG
jgi:hypothetical protein